MTDTELLDWIEEHPWVLMVQQGRVWYEGRSDLKWSKDGQTYGEIRDVIKAAVQREAEEMT